MFSARRSDRCNRYEGRSSCCRTRERTTEGCSMYHERNPIAMKCPKLREWIVNDNGGCTDFRCKKYKVVVFYKNWGRPCDQYDKEEDAKNGDHGDHDDAGQTDNVKPEISDARINEDSSDDVVVG